MLARFRIIREVLDGCGQGIVSAWVAKELTTVDKAKVESRFNQIEISEIRNPKWLDSYRSLKMWEIRVDSRGKALRFLCEVDGANIIVVVGCVKRGQIKLADEQKASARRDEYRKGNLGVRDYPLPQRPPDDVEEPSR